MHVATPTLNATAISAPATSGRMVFSGVGWHYLAGGLFAVGGLAAMLSGRVCGLTPRPRVPQTVFGAEEDWHEDAADLELSAADERETSR